MPQAMWSSWGLIAVQDILQQPRWSGNGMGFVKRSGLPRLRLPEIYQLLVLEVFYNSICVSSLVSSSSSSCKTAGG